jgi:hypothetical protein
MFRCAIALLLLAFLAPLSFSKSKIIPPADSDYVLALGAANDFLRAWQRQDCEAGILLLTDRVKQRTPEDALVSFFSRTVRRAQSFEIMHGKKLAPGRYRFPVSLFQQPAGASPKWISPRTSTLVVVKTGAREWSIDKLP